MTKEERKKQRDHIREHGRMSLPVEERPAITELETWGDILGQSIKQKGFTVQHIAQGINCSEQSIYKWIQGTQYPTIIFFHNLIRFLYPYNFYEIYMEWTEIIIKEREKCGN